MQETAALEKTRDRVVRVLQITPRLLAGEGLNFFLDSFKQQGWLGNGGMDRWANRKNPNRWGPVKRPERALLVDSGNLRRSVRIVNASASQVVWGSDLPYARIHNEGSRLGVIQKVNAFQRRSKTGKMVTVRAHTRRINQRIPKRQFMGSSTYLSKRLERTLEAEFRKALNNI